MSKSTNPIPDVQNWCEVHAGNLHMDWKDQKPLLQALAQQTMPKSSWTEGSHLTSLYSISYFNMHPEFPWSHCSSQSQTSLSDSSRRTREPTTLKDSKKKKLVPKQLAALSFICKCPRSDTVPDFWRTGHMSQIIQLISKHLQGYRLSILTNLS